MLFFSLYLPLFLSCAVIVGLWWMTSYWHSGDLAGANPWLPPEGDRPAGYSGRLRIAAGFYGEETFPWWHRLWFLDGSVTVVFSFFWLRQCTRLVVWPALEAIDQARSIRERFAVDPPSTAQYRRHKEVGSRSWAFYAKTALSIAARVLQQRQRPSNDRSGGDGGGGNGAGPGPGHGPGHGTGGKGHASGGEAAVADPFAESAPLRTFIAERAARFLHDRWRATYVHDKLRAMAAESRRARRHAAKFLDRSSRDGGGALGAGEAFAAAGGRGGGRWRGGGSGRGLQKLSSTRRFGLELGLPSLKVLPPRWKHERTFANPPGDGLPPPPQGAQEWLRPEGRCVGFDHTCHRNRVVPVGSKRVDP